MIEFTHKTSSRARRLQIKISSKGEVIVTSPRFVPKFLVNQFVRQQESWIVEKLALVTKTHTPHNNSTVVIFGKEYHKKVVYLAKTALGIHIQGEAVVINTPEALTTETTWLPKHQKQLERFLKNTASSYIVQRTQQLAEKMHTTYKNIALKQQSSRWGSCSSLGNLNFNWRLVHATPAIIDYVIIHELAHRTEMNHSAGFWNIVAKYDPDYRVHQGWLKRNGHGLS